MFPSTRTACRSCHHRRVNSFQIRHKIRNIIMYASREYDKPEGLSKEEEKEWNALMSDPAVYELFHGMGSSGLSGEKPNNAPGELIEI